MFLKKGVGQGGRPNRRHSGLIAMHAFGHHIPAEDSVAAAIATGQKASPAQQRCLSLPPDGGRGSSARRSAPPVAQAFGSTVSHDPRALPFALGQPSLSDIEHPDATPFLPASVGGPAVKASAMERAVDSIANTLSDVATSLARGTAQADFAMERMRTSPPPEQVRSELVRHGLTGPQASGRPQDSVIRRHSSWQGSTRGAPRDRRAA
uniref:Uncharacterized protein n=1 Tax=Tetraselmis sp. GSL018 TaxID=582737 RepID=A0A061RL81_9CHLO